MAHFYLDHILQNDLLNAIAHQCFQCFTSHYHLSRIGSNWCQSKQEHFQMCLTIWSLPSDAGGRSAMATNRQTIPTYLLIYWRKPKLLGPRGSETGFESIWSCHKKKGWWPLNMTSAVWKEVRNRKKLFQF